MYSYFGLNEKNKNDEVKFAVENKYIMNMIYCKQLLMCLRWTCVKFGFSPTKFNIKSAKFKCRHMQYAPYRAGNILMVSQVDDSILFGLKLNH